MYKFSFRIRHHDCAETTLSITFPKHSIVVMDIQSQDQKNKQYLYSITGNPKQFEDILAYLHSIPAYTFVEEVERKDHLLLLVKLRQKSYIQNAIQRHSGFLIDTHTLSEGYEYWHVGLFKKAFLSPLRKEIEKMGDFKVLQIADVDFSHIVLTDKQKKILFYALDRGYYETPRKITIEHIARAFKLHKSTVGEHLLRVENKLIKGAAKRI